MEFVGKGIIVLTSELSAQLEKFPHGEVSVLVPEGSCNERGKMYAKGKAVFNLLWKWLIFQLLLEPKMADKLSASLPHQKKRVFESTPGILSKFADVIHTPCDRKSFLYWSQDMTTPAFSQRET